MVTTAAVVWCDITIYRRIHAYRNGDGEVDSKTSVIFEIYDAATRGRLPQHADWLTVVEPVAARQELMSFKFVRCGIVEKRSVVSH